MGELNERSLLWIDYPKTETETATEMELERKRERDVYPILRPTLMIGRYVYFVCEKQVAEMSMFVDAQHERGWSTGGLGVLSQSDPQVASSSSYKRNKKSHHDLQEGKIQSSRRFVCASKLFVVVGDAGKGPQSNQFCWP